LHAGGGSLATLTLIPTAASRVYGPAQRHISVEGEETPPIRLAASSRSPASPAGNLGFRARRAGELSGWRVVAIENGGAAAAAGVRIGNMITRVDGIDVTQTERDIYQNLINVSPGTSIAITLADGRELSVVAE
jgi:C-terminal processing protease CtpA/Prc